MDHRLHGRLHPLALRNPFRNEGDAFRLLVVVGIAAAIVIAVTLVAGETAGALLGLVLLVVAAVLAWRWLREAIGSPER